MELFAGKWYIGKSLGPFKLVKITPTSKLNQAPVFHVLINGNETPTILTLEEIRQEKPRQA